MFLERDWVMILKIEDTHTLQPGNPLLEICSLKTKFGKKTYLFKVKDVHISIVCNYTNWKTKSMPINRGIVD